MLKQIAWNTFKNTGNINTFMELVELDNINKNITKNNNYNSTNTDLTKNEFIYEDNNGNNKNEGYNNFRK